MRTERDKLKLLRQLAKEVDEIRLEMAGKDFAGYRQDLGGHMVALRLKVLVPVCADCWVDSLHMLPDVPDVSADNWQVDLLLLGFSGRVIQELQQDIEDGIGEERGPWCDHCHKWLPYWQDGEGCFVKEVGYDDYFGFIDKTSPSVSKEMRNLIIRMYGRTCFACGTELRWEDVTIDHVVAQSRGGTGDQVNLQVLCKSCNNAKADAPINAIKATLHFPMRPVPSDAYDGVTW